MRVVQQAIIAICVMITLGSCSKESEPIIFESGRTKVEITGKKFSLDPWRVNVKVTVDNNELYELTQLEIYSSELTKETVHFDCLNNKCAITFDQMDGSVYTIPNMKLPVEE